MIEETSQSLAVSLSKYIPGNDDFEFAQRGNALAVPARAAVYVDNDYRWCAGCAQSFVTCPPAQIRVFGVQPVVLGPATDCVEVLAADQQERTADPVGIDHRLDICARVRIFLGFNKTQQALDGSEMIQKIGKDVK